MSKRPPKLAPTARRDTKPEKPAAPQHRYLGLERGRHPHPVAEAGVARWMCACGDRGYWMAEAFADVAEAAGRDHEKSGKPGSNPPEED